MQDLNHAPNPLADVPDRPARSPGRLALSGDLVPGDACTLWPQGVRVAMAGHRSVLDAALAAGVSVPFSCQRGACGSCAAECVEGEVEPVAGAATEGADPGPGRVLMCQVRARGELVLRVPDWEPQALPQRRDMRVLAREALGPDVVGLVLDPGGALPSRPGQHVRVRLADGDHRCFSIANRRVNAHDPIELQIRRVPGGRFSDLQLSALSPGDLLDVEAAFGAPGVPATPGAPDAPDAPDAPGAPGALDSREASSVSEPAAPLVLLATGTGYAGVRALIQEALADAEVPAVTLYWGGRHAADHYARSELEAWAAMDRRFRWTAVAPEATKGHAGQDDVLQRRVQDHALADGHDWTATRVHACGNPAMLRDARAALQAAGLPASHWQADAFVSSGRESAPHDWERSGPRFDLAGIVEARERSIAAVHDIAARLRPGMSSQEARLMADERLRALGSQRTWHPTIVRLGDDTTLTSREPGDPARRLRPDDIVFIDIGPVWDGYEGDYGDTFVLGADEAHLRCAAAARAVFDEARAAWVDGASGTALYALAETAAQRHGCTLVKEMAGHRVSDFPHALYGRHKLAQAGFAPGDGLWVLEIQLRDQERPVGAFFEDVLMRRLEPAPTAMPPLAREPRISPAAPA